MWTGEEWEEIRGTVGVWLGVVHDVDDAFDLCELW